MKNNILTPALFFAMSAFAPDAFGDDKGQKHEVYMHVKGAFGEDGKIDASINETDYGYEGPSGPYWQNRTPYTIELLGEKEARISAHSFGPVIEEMRCHSESGCESKVSKSKSFNFWIPSGPGVKRAIIKHEGKIVFERNRSAQIPKVRLTNPVPGSVINAPNVRVEWQGEDADNDKLSYQLFYKVGNEEEWSCASFQSESMSHEDNIEHIAPGSRISYKILCTDGFNTSYDIIELTIAGRERLHAGDGERNYLAEAEVLLNTGLFHQHERAAFNALLYEWASEEPKDAVEWAQSDHRIPFDQPEALKSVAIGWANKEPDVAIRLASSDALEDCREDALRGVVFAWAKKDPATAAAVAAGIIGYDQGVRILPSSFWVEHNPDKSEAVDRILKESYSGNVLYEIVCAWTWAEPEKAAAWAAGMKDHDFRSVVWGAVARVWGVRDPDKALLWASTLFPEAKEPMELWDKRQVMVNIASTWSDLDRKSAMEWIEAAEQGQVEWINPRDQELELGWMRQKVFPQEE